MKKRLMAVLTALAFVLVSLGLTAPAAIATTVTIESSSYSESSLSANTSTVTRASASGKVQLTYFNPTAKSWSLKKAKKCKLVKVKIGWKASKIRKVVKKKAKRRNGTYCVRIKKGSTWANSGKSGQYVVPFTAKVRGSWSLMTLKSGKPRKKGVWEHRGEYSNGHFEQVCLNWWKIGLRPTLKDTDVLMVRSESEINYRVKGLLTSRGNVSAMGSIICAAGKITGSGSADGNGSVEFDLWVTASSEAEARSRGASRAMATSKLANDARTTATTNGSANIKFNLECDDKTPTPTPPPPPVDNPPAISITGLPHLYVGGNDAVWFEAFDPDGDAVNVQINATGAGWVSGLVEVDIRWDATPCPIGKHCYRATAWGGPTPGMMKITVKVSSLSLSDEAVSSFPIVADEF